SSDDDESLIRVDHLLPPRQGAATCERPARGVVREEAVARSGPRVSGAGTPWAFRVTAASPVSWMPRQTGVKRTGRGVGEGGDLIDDHPFAGPVVGGGVEQGAELRVEAVRGAGGERLGQPGDDDALVGAQAFLFGALHDIAVGDGLE